MRGPSPSITDTYSLGVVMYILRPRGRAFYFVMRNRKHKMHLSEDHILA